MSQHDMILSYMERRGSITPMDAFADLGITKLATRIGELIRAGVPINKTIETGKNRFGKTIQYMRYSIDSERRQPHAEH